MKKDMKYRRNNILLANNKLHGTQTFPRKQTINKSSENFQIKSTTTKVLILHMYKVNLQCFMW